MHTGLCLPVSDYHPPPAGAPFMRGMSGDFLPVTFFFPFSDFHLFFVSAYRRSAPPSDRSTVNFDH